MLQDDRNDKKIGIQLSSSMHLHRKVVLFIFLVPRLTSGHGIVERIDFDCFLTEGAFGTTKYGKDVADRGSHQVLLLPDLLSDQDHADEIGYGHQHDKSLDEAIFSHLLGNLSFGVAGQEVGDDAHLEIAEASKKSLFEFSRHA